MRGGILGILLYFISFTTVFADSFSVFPPEVKNQIYIKFRDVPEGPSLFIVAGMTYTYQSSYCEINLEVYTDGHLDYQLSNLSGEVLLWDNQRLTNGSNNLGLSLSGYPAGIYQLDMSLGKEQKTLIIEKLPHNKIIANLITKVE